MRSAINNPFNPGSDLVPQVWAGRTAQLEDWRVALRPRLVRGLPERGRTILGEPGLGKSALVRRIAAEAADKGDWVTPQIRVPSGSDPLKLVAEALLKLAHAAGLASRREKHLEALLGRVQSVAVSGVSLGLREGGGPDPHVVLSELLIEIGHAAMKQGVACLVHIDEEDLVLALQDFVIPGWETVDDRGGLTTIHVTQDAVAVLVDLCRGEPFLFQLAGQQAWYAGDDDVVTAEQVRAGWRTAQREAAAHVERILGRLPQRERELLEAMAQLPPADRTLTRIADRAGFPSAAAAGPTSQRLDTVRGIIDRGKPYSFRHRAVEAYLTSDWPKLG